jgi:hypothetical protein
MIGRFGCGLLMLVLGTSIARAQDVPGIEICTVEKTLERRTSCLQSNVEFLQKTIAKLALDHQQRLDAANRQIDALKANVITLQGTVDDLKAAQAKTPDSAKKADTSSPRDVPAKDAIAKDTTKDGTGKDASAKEGGK